jgi:rubrerythrin
VHAELYQEAKQAVDSGQDASVEKMYVCSVCGWTGVGDPPDNCPLCNAKKEFLKTFE